MRLDSMAAKRDERKFPEKLRKLPHVFSKVVELPFRSDADVAVEEGPNSFRFFAKINVNYHVTYDDVRAHAVEIHPGVVKIVIRNGHELSSYGGGGVELFLDQLEVDTWCFPLPSSTLPERATAGLVDGQLTLTVPKGGSHREFVRGEGFGEVAKTCSCTVGFDVQGCFFCLHKL